jgi:hypothetical protein
MTSSRFVCARVAHARPALPGAAVFVIALLVAWPSAARADAIRFDFQGVVTDNTANLGVFGSFGTVNLGDVVTGHIAYETGPGNPDQDPGDPDLGLYDLLEFVIDQAVVPIAAEGIGILRIPPAVVIDPMAPPDLGSDFFRAVGSFDIGGTMFIVSLDLEAPYDAVFSDDSLPAGLTLADFTTVQRVRAVRVLGLEPGGSQIDTAQLTELASVPEPAVLGLLALAASAFGLRRRARAARFR